jgi:hypothetical protein
MSHRYCDTCRPIVNAEKIHIRDARRPVKMAKVGSTLTCPKCSGSFTKTTASQLYCSPMCGIELTRRCRVCSASFEGRANQLYCSAKCRKQHRNSQPKERISRAMRTAVATALLRQKNGRSWEKLAGYTATDLMAHLARQFKAKMSWDNYGSVWEIDHVMPLASFSFTSADDPEFRAAWALTNLRPLSKHQNRSKSWRRTLLV